MSDVFQAEFGNRSSTSESEKGRKFKRISDLRNYFGSGIMAEMSTLENAPGGCSQPK